MIALLKLVLKLASASLKVLHAVIPLSVGPPIRVQYLRPELKKQLESQRFKRKPSP